MTAGRNWSFFGANPKRMNFRPLHYVLALSLAANVGVAAYFGINRIGLPTHAANEDGAKAKGNSAGKATKVEDTGAQKFAQPGSVKSAVPPESAEKTRVPPKSVSRPAANNGKSKTKTMTASAKQRAEQRYNFLSAEKAGRLQQIERDYAELARRAHVEARNSGTGSADSQRLALLREERRRDIEALLTPGELSEYDRRFSSAGILLERTFDNMNSMLSESEKQAIFDLRKAVIDTYSSSDAPVNNETVLYRQLAQETVNSEIKAILGDDRYYDYVRAQSTDYRNLRGVVSVEVANDVYALRDNVAAESQRIHSDRSMSYAQKQEAFANLAEQIRTQVRELMGDNAGNAFLDGNMNWLRYVQQGSSIRFNGSGDSVTFNTLRAPSGKQ